MGRYNPARRRSKPAKGKPQTAILLDAYSPGEIKRLQDRQEALGNLWWRFFSELAGQRAKVIDELKAALTDASSGPFQFESFQRAVKYRWSLNPLSPEGSLRDPVGGRFNIGAIDPVRYPPFPALYLAKDKDTAIQEIFNIEPAGRGGLSPQELSLAKGDSISVVAVRGSLDSVLDLNHPNGLKPFVQIISKFRCSPELVRDAKAFGVDISTLTTVPKLLQTLLMPDWRNLPVHVDVPGNGQIFGSLVEQAGIEAILYPSKYTQKECLAVFTRNFAGGGSFVELVGGLPPGVVTQRIDASNCGDF